MHLVLNVCDEERLSAWILGIAKNLLVDFRRRRREEPVPEGDDVVGPGEEPEFDAVVGSWLASTVEEFDEGRANLGPCRPHEQTAPNTRS